MPNGNTAGIDNSKRVALVIGSGGVKCAAALGLQNVLMREGIAIDMVVGCSGGSIYAALIAAGYDAATVIDMNTRLWTRDLTRKRHTSSLLAALMPKLFRFNAQFGLKDDQRVNQRLREVFGELRFETMKIPLYLTATDFMTGDQVVFSSGSVFDAIRASIAIPFVFKPWRVNERLFVDGSMSDPLPVGVAIKEGAQLIVAIGFDSPYQAEVDSAARFGFQISSIMSNNLLRAKFAFHNLAHHSEVIPVIPNFTQRIRLFDIGKVPYIVEEGERAAEEQLPYLRRLMSIPAPGTQFPDPIRPGKLRSEEIPNCRLVDG